MSVLAKRTLFCDNCDDQVDGQPNQTATELRALARADGWRKWQGRDLCRSCMRTARSPAEATPAFTTPHKNVMGYQPPYGHFGGGCYS